MPSRKRSRLETFDYATVGAYFVTICAYRREAIFGRCVDDELRRTTAGLIVERCWSEIPFHFQAVDVDAFVVMPNHVHGILFLGDESRPLPTIVGSFKSAASRKINLRQDSPSIRTWQRGYYERVLRSTEELDAIRRYILENPAAWAGDPDNPDRSRIVASAPWL